jgi:hypothetical protein
MVFLNKTVYSTGQNYYFLIPNSELKSFDFKYYIHLVV